MCYPQENSCPGHPGVKRSNFGPKIDFSKNIVWTTWYIFLIFCMKLDTNKTLPTMYMLPLGKLLPRPRGSQKVKFGPKLDFSKLYPEPCARIRWLNSRCCGSSSTLFLVLYLNFKFVLCQCTWLIVSGCIKQLTKHFRSCFVLVMHFFVCWNVESLLRAAMFQ